MTLSPDSIEAVTDLIQNKLAIMTIGDRDDLREMVTLKKALNELHGDPVEAGILKNFSDIPRRGRRRKIADMMGERD